MDKRYFSNDKDHFSMKAYTDVIFVLRKKAVLLSTKKRSLFRLLFEIWSYALRLSCIIFRAIKKNPQDWRFISIKAYAQHSCLSCGVAEQCSWVQKRSPIGLLHDIWNYALRLSCVIFRAIKKNPQDWRFFSIKAYAQHSCLSCVKLKATL